MTAVRQEHWILLGDDRGSVSVFGAMLGLTVVTCSCVSDPGWATLEILLHANQMIWTHQWRGRIDDDSVQDEFRFGWCAVGGQIWRVG